MLKEEFAAFGPVIIKYKVCFACTLSTRTDSALQDLDGDMVRLSARNLSKVVSTFLKTESKKVDMTMENEDGGSRTIQLIVEETPQISRNKPWRMRGE